MSRDEIRAVLDQDHPIIHTGKQILDEVRHLFKDVVPDIVLIEMTLGIEPDSLPDVPIDAVTPALQVCVLRGYHNRGYVFGLLASGSEAPLTDQDALKIISEAIQTGQTGLAVGTNYQIVARGTVRHLEDPRFEPASLTTRELEVLHHLSVGKTNQAISQELSISEWTVRFHVKNIFRKLGVKRRSEAVAWVARARGAEQTPKPML